MHVKPYLGLGEKLGRGKSGFAVNWDAVNGVLLYIHITLYICVICIIYANITIRRTRTQQP